jgi:hypothetical protein
MLLHVQLAAALPGRSLQECEQLQKQYHTFLGLPHSQSLQAAFVAMVKDMYKNTADDDEVRQSAQLQRVHSPDMTFEAVDAVALAVALPAAATPVLHYLRTEEQERAG